MQIKTFGNAQKLLQNLQNAGTCTTHNTARRQHLFLSISSVTSPYRSEAQWESTTSQPAFHGLRRVCAGTVLAHSSAPGEHAGAHSAGSGRAAARPEGWGSLTGTRFSAGSSAAVLPAVGLTTAGTVAAGLNTPEPMGLF
eukprot:RCo023270